MATCRGARWSAVFLIGASLAACVDAGVGPAVRQGPESVGVSLDATAYVGDTAVTTFTVSPSIGATYVAGPAPPREPPTPRPGPPPPPRAGGGPPRRIKHFSG